MLNKTYYGSNHKFTSQGPETIINITSGYDESLNIESTSITLDTLNLYLEIPLASDNTNDYVLTTQPLNGIWGDYQVLNYGSYINDPLGLSGLTQPNTYFSGCTADITNSIIVLISTTYSGLNWNVCNFNDNGTISYYNVGITYFIGQALPTGSYTFQMDLTGLLNVYNSSNVIVYSYGNPNQGVAPYYFMMDSASNGIPVIVDSNNKLCWFAGQKPSSFYTIANHHPQYTSTYSVNSTPTYSNSFISYNQFSQIKASSITINNSSGSLTTTGQLISTVATGTAPIVVNSTTLVPNLYVQRAQFADNANGFTISGPITILGTTSSITSQTGLGTIFVVQTGPTIISPYITNPYIAGSSSFGSSVGNSIINNSLIYNSGITNSSLINAVLFNAQSNNFIDTSRTSVSASGTTILTTIDTKNQVLTGTLNQSFQLPNATTVIPGYVFEFNNKSSGICSINDGAGNPLYNIPSGGLTKVINLTNTTIAGTWDEHSYLPSNYYFGSTGATVSGNLYITGSSNLIGLLQTGTLSATGATIGSLVVSSTGLVSNLYAARSLISDTVSVLGTQGTKLLLTGTVDSTQFTTGTLVVDGGLGLSKGLTIQNQQTVYHQFPDIGSVPYLETSPIVSYEPYINQSSGSFYTHQYQTTVVAPGNASYGGIYSTDGFVWMQFSSVAQVYAQTSHSGSSVYIGLGNGSSSLTWAYTIGSDGIFRITDQNGNISYQTPNQPYAGNGGPYFFVCSNDNRVYIIDSASNVIWNTTNTAYGTPGCSTPTATNCMSSAANNNGIPLQTRTNYGIVYQGRSARLGSSLTLYSTTDSTNTATGSLVVSGGAAIDKSLIVGGTITTNSLSAGTLTANAGSFTGSLYTNTTLNVGSGAYEVHNCGANFAAGITLGGTYSYFNSTNSLFQSTVQVQPTYQLTCWGPLVCAVNVTIAGQMWNYNTSPSTGYNSGALQIAGGGLGVYGNIYAGGNIDTLGTIRSTGAITSTTSTVNQISFPVLAAYQSGSQTITTGSAQLATLSSYIDNCSKWNSGSSYYTIPMTGYYSVTASIQSSVNQPSGFQVLIYKGGSVDVASAVQTNVLEIIYTRLCYFTVGDSVQMYYYALTGGSLNSGTYFTIHYVSA